MGALPVTWDLRRLPILPNLQPYLWSIKMLSPLSFIVCISIAETIFEVIYHENYIVTLYLGIDPKRNDRPIRIIETIVTKNKILPTKYISKSIRSSQGNNCQVAGNFIRSGAVSVRLSNVLQLVDLQRQPRNCGSEVFELPRWPITF